MDSIEELDSIINKVVNQTNYSPEEAERKLVEYDFDAIKVIKLYLGGNKKDSKPQIKSVNQEIYKQIRTRMTAVSTEYHKSNPINIDHVRENFQSYENNENKNT